MLPNEIKNHPNFDFIINTTTKLSQLQTKIKTELIVVTFESETCGSVLLGDINLTRQAKINILLEVMRKLNIPFKELKDLNGT